MKEAVSRKGGGLLLLREGETGADGTFSNR